MEALVVSSRVVVPPNAMTFAASRAGGPGGQNVNKVSSKVELRVAIPDIRGLSSAERDRLALQTRSRLDEEGRIVVTSQRSRSQAQNLEDARDKLREMIALSLVPPRRRIRTKPTRASKAARLADKKRHSEKKKSRRVPLD